jgi:hypothetical protein
MYIHNVVQLCCALKDMPLPNKIDDKQQQQQHETKQRQQKNIQ